MICKVLSFLKQGVGWLFDPDMGYDLFGGLPYGPLISASLVDDTQILLLFRMLVMTTLLLTLLQLIKDSCFLSYQYNDSLRSKVPTGPLPPVRQIFLCLQAPITLTCKSLLSHQTV
jgi:hypothetical protein